MGRKKVNTTVYLEPEQVERLAELSSRTGVPQAVYVREGLDLVLAKHADKLPGQATIAEVLAEYGWDDDRGSI